VSETAEPKIEFRRNIVYATHDGVELQGDLYLPAGAGPFPLLVNVHGGYWRRGARDTYQYWGPYLAQRGYAGFTISYRLTKPGRKTFPEAVHDVRAAVQFMRGCATELRLDPDRFALWGNSAGAQLAALVALAGDSPLFAGGYRQDPHAALSTSVKVLIGVYGIYDLVGQWRSEIRATIWSSRTSAARPCRTAAFISMPRRSAMRSSATTRPRSF
jgi:acetyl esterase/lipase